MKKNEFGRSMVEMLGVLAIIGVLSVGGITGYRTAMDRYKANKLINEIQIGLIEMSAQYKATGSYNTPSGWLKDFGRPGQYHPQCGLDMKNPCFYISDIEEGICQALPISKDMFDNMGFSIGSAVDTSCFSDEALISWLSDGDSCKEGKGILIFIINPDLFQGEDDYVY